MTQDTIVLLRLLAQALAYPDQNFVATLRTAIGKIKLELYDDDALPLGTFVQAFGELAQAPLEQVQGEHTRLFINAYPRVPCPPYESVYREGVMLGEAAQQVGAAYRAWGLVVENEQVDHVGAELEFIAFLLMLDTPAARDAANTFTREHFVRWLPRFADDVNRESQLAFYRALAELLTAVLRRELRAQALA